MSTIADLLIKVRADTGGAEKDISTFGSRVAGGFKKALVPAVGALTIMGVAGKAAFANLQDGAKNAHQTEQVIKTTGGAANVTAKHVDELAMSLRRKAGVDDDVVHVGENMLLTFTNVRNEVGKGNDVFDQATSTVLDMSVALGQDTKSSAIQLGKALNDPIKGITALQRVGVSFTAKQREQIKTLVEHGHVLEAQKVILHELGREFGGAATNIDPMQRSMANLKLDTVDLASSLIQGLMPALQTVVGMLGTATAFMQDHQKATKIVIAVIAALAVGVIAVNVAMKLYAAGAVLVRAATLAWTAAQWLLNAALAANPIGLVIIALAALGAALVILFTKSETFRHIVITAWNDIKATTITVWNAIKDFFVKWWPLMLIVATGGVGAIAVLLIKKWGEIKADAVAAWNAVRTATTGAWETIKGAVTAGVNGAKTAVTSGVNAIENVVTSVFSALRGAVAGEWNAIRDAITGPINAAKNAVLAAVAAIKGALNDSVGAMVGAVRAIKGAMNDAIAGVNDVIGKLNSIHIPGFNIHIPGVSVLGHTIFGGADVGWGGMDPFHIPMLASGARNFAGGLAIVGEQGPELVSLPRGADVFAHDESRRMAGGVTIQGDLVIREEIDIDRAAAKIGRRLALAGL